MSDFEVKTSRNGLGGFAIKPFCRGEIVYDWSGCKRFTKAELPYPYIDDRFLQVAPDCYIGSFDGPKNPDDYFNHSCDPNCVIKLEPKLSLVALRDINVGEEITYDYSLTIYDDSWKMVCNCGALNCRKIIEELVQ